MLGARYHADIDALRVDNVITPYRIGDRKEQVEVLMTANGNKPIMSQRESIEQYGMSDDVEQTMREIAEEEKADSFDLTE